MRKKGKKCFIDFSINLTFDIIEGKLIIIIRSIPKAYLNSSHVIPFAIAFNVYYFMAFMKSA